MVYCVLKLYLKDDELRKDIKHMIVDYGTADKAMRQVILAYKAGRLNTTFL